MAITPDPSQSTGFVLPSSAITIPRSSADWSNPDRVQEDDGLTALTTLTNAMNPAESDWLVPQFEFPMLPSTAVIGGIEIKVQAWRATGFGGLQLNEWQLFNSTSAVGDPKATPKVLTDFAEDFVIGAGADKWGVSVFSTNMVKSGAFGFGIIGELVSGVNAVIGVDAMWMNVYYEGGQNRNRCRPFRRAPTLGFEQLRRE